MTHTVTLTNPQQAHDILTRAGQWIKGRVMQGRPVTLTLREAKRTLPQNSLIHPCVISIAKALGRPTDAESLRKLRYLLLEQWRHETGRSPMFERSYDGMRWVCVDKGTSDLDKPDCSEFIEFLLAQEAGLSA
jgi:hypothetical protein